ncbi:MAG: HNH endonuclease [Proteobacteria bacterium]|nr:HNH endonuclease [Pseudomonadota bacterium]
MATAVASTFACKTSPWITSSPATRGGTDHPDNLQLLCGHCNSVKGDRGQEYLIAKLAA